MQIARHAAEFRLEAVEQVVELVHSAVDAAQGNRASPIFFGSRAVTQPWPQIKTDTSFFCVAYSVS